MSSSHANAGQSNHRSAQSVYATHVPQYRKWSRQDKKKPDTDADAYVGAHSHRLSIFEFSISEVKVVLPFKSL